ncbi:MULTISPECIES: c-type cytochrome [unclassified Chelatococcus]|uniref:c-type cytochrome n=1 Tax=unclassified Chelatococcus TaxID=2638111 RepID=UPI00224BDB42|nr:c-type cytochrome [Chelatococcus sp.]MCO5075596.1 c-type cytochrome [Chelatococcus sp.]CAH1655103.1 Cytochrome c family protein [Hyphomicrobiales bacterium]CAH1695264.1 Cytochrome c family protein [Hyphomicrobiales bacterium]
MNCITIFAPPTLESGHNKKLAAGLLIVILRLSPLFFPFAVAAQQDDGERLFRQRCATCHSVDPGQNKMAPNLHGIIGRAAGSLEGASYSGAMRSSRMTWDRQSLDSFLAAPSQVVRGTRMTAGVPTAAQRAAIIRYLESQSPD